MNERTPGPIASHLPGAGLWGCKTFDMIGYSERGSDKRVIHKDELRDLMRDRHNLQDLVRDLWKSVDGLDLNARQYHKLERLARSLNEQK